MLARQDWHQPPIQPLPDLDYSGFPHWHALMTEPNREQKAAEWLKKVNIHVYLPLFSKQTRRARGICCHRLCPVLPCMMFVPAEFLDHQERDRVLDWAGARLLKSMRAITKSEIEVIRDVEAKLNRKPTKKMGSLSINARVRFYDEMWADLLGEATVFEIASEQRIGVEVHMLFGCRRKVYVPASEIEAI